ncbi:unknown [Parabacteroides johnsonii CAG:246]|nr:unknown [Parabacteroides johnsonii CAG:246]
MKKKTLLKLLFTASCLLAAYCLLNNRETMALTSWHSKI